MDKSDPKNIIKKHYSTLDKFIKLVNEDFETEAIHKLRVEYKKLRAFLRMISTENSSQKKIKIPGKLKKVYAIAGSIRDLQLQQKSMLTITGESTKKTKSYLKLLEHQVSILQSQWRDVPLEKTIIKSLKKTDEIVFEKINAIAAGRFINNNCTAIAAIITGRNFSNLNMHVIRKYLKDIFYTIQQLENAEDEIKFNSIEIFYAEKKYLDKLLEEFGNLQDKNTSITLLDEHWLYPLDKAGREILIRIKNVFITERDVLTKALIQRLEHEIIPPLEKLKNVKVCTV